MYTEAPLVEITLDEFELMALDRLQVLRKIEDLKVPSYSLRIWGYTQRLSSGSAHTCTNRCFDLLRASVDLVR